MSAAEGRGFTLPYRAFVPRATTCGVGFITLFPYLLPCRIGSVVQTLSEETDLAGMKGESKITPLLSQSKSVF